MAYTLDSTDRALLGLVQKNTRTSTEALSEKIGLSTPAIHRRLKKLREKGIIEAEVAILNGKKLGKKMTFIVSLEVERERVDLLDSLKKDMVLLPEVQQCYYVTGESDFIIIVKVQDMEDYERFTQEAFFKNSNIRKFRTSVVMNEVKVSLEIPL